MPDEPIVTPAEVPAAPAEAAPETPLEVVAPAEAPAPEPKQE
jgi:hypothetical protein